MRRAVIAASIAVLLLAAGSSSAKTSPRIPQAVANTLVTAPIGTCANDWYRFGCHPPKRFAPLSRRSPQCQLSASRPRRAVNWTAGVATLQCSPGVEDTSVWAYLNMYTLSPTRGWREAAKSQHQGKVYLSQGFKTWATAWSQCTGGFGDPQYVRAWETDAHATFEIGGTWFTKHPVRAYANVACVHNV